MAGTHHLHLHLLNITDISQILIRTHFIIIIFITHNSSENTGQGEEERWEKWKILIIIDDLLT